MIIEQSAISVQNIQDQSLVINNSDNVKCTFDDLSCVHGLKLRDPRSLERLVEQYENVLKRVAYLQVGDRDLVDDIVQATFIAAWVGAPRLKKESRLRPWMFGILFNQCRKTLRSLKRKKSREKIGHELQQIRKQESECKEIEEHLEKLKHALMNLKEEQRELIILKYEQELPLVEISMILGISLGTVKSRLHRAIKSLREKMGVKSNG